MLWLIVSIFRGHKSGKGSWRSAAALFVYAIAYTCAYVTLPAAMGALLLFGAVQATMIGYGISKGERLHGWQIVGLVLALAGLVSLLLPGLTAPPFTGSSSCWAAALHGASIRCAAGERAMSPGLRRATFCVQFPWRRQ
jgi:drug/metabolite transporter (DMT)-like permease